MTRKELELIARALRDARPCAAPETIASEVGRRNVLSAHSAINNVARNLVDEISAKHPRFDRDAFLTATGFRHDV